MHHQSDSLLNEARELARSQQWTIDQVLEKKSTIGFHDRRFLKWCTSVQDELIPRLKEAICQKGKDQKLSFSILLLSLGDPAGAEGIIDILRSGESKLCRDALRELKILIITNQAPYFPENRELTLPIDPKEVFSALEPFWAEPDSRTGQDAMIVAIYLGLPEADQKLRTFLQHPSQEVRFHIIHLFLWSGFDYGAVEAIKTLVLGDNDENRDVETALKFLRDLYFGLGRKNNVLTCGAVRDLLASYIRANVCYSDEPTAQALSEAVSCLALVKHPDEQKILQSIIVSPCQKWLKEITIERLIYLEGVSGIQRLRNALLNEDYRGGAARGLVAVAEEYQTVDIIPDLISAFEQEHREEVLEGIVDALVAVGRKAVVPFLEQNYQPIDPFHAMQFAWLIQDITPDKAIALMVNTNIIEPPPSALMEAIARRWKKYPWPFEIICRLLYEAKRLAGPTFWTPSTFPVEHVPLIEELVEIASDVLAVEAISQIVPPQNPELLPGHSEYLVQFIAHEKLYRFTTHSVGYGYDIESVVKALNTALEDTAKRERFIFLGVGPHKKEVTFAVEDVFKEIARELYLPLKK